MAPHERLPPGTDVVLYDGVCGLCDRFVQFVLVRDTRGRFKFAALQNDAAADVLAKYGLDPNDLNTVYVVADWRSDHERVLSRSRAILYAVERLGGVWAPLARLASVLPAPISDLVYQGVARIRYRIFGRYDVCAIPPRDVRQRFLDQSVDAP